MFCFQICIINWQRYLFTHILYENVILYLNPTFLIVLHLFKLSFVQSPVQHYHNFNIYCAYSLMTMSDSFIIFVISRYWVTSFVSTPHTYAIYYILYVHIRLIILRRLGKLSTILDYLAVISPTWAILLLYIMVVSYTLFY